jgi:2-phospho-L-lactate guanylyltransferase
MSRWQLLVPVKGTTRAKSRLGDAFGPHRPQLALAFARDTVAAAMACPLVEQVTVVTGDTVAAVAFKDTAAQVFEDFHSRALNPAISLAVREVPRLRDADRLAVLLGDLPALTSPALGRALELAEPHEAAFVPDAAATGTTLLCARGSRRDIVQQPCFGVESAMAHEAVGAVRLRDARLETLRRDVDDVDDLLAAQRLGLGEHTVEILREIGWTTPDPAQLAGESLMLEHIGGR